MLAGKIKKLILTCLVLLVKVELNRKILILFALSLAFGTQFGSEYALLKQKPSRKSSWRNRKLKNLRKIEE